MRLWRVPYPKFGQGPGLERVALIAEKLGLDLAAFGEAGAVIVGSNGKGSAAAMTAALLAQGGASVGLFTSPHLFALNERFRIGDDDISDEELEHHWDRVAAAAEVCGQTEQLGGFEFLFLIAADWFAARSCVHTVWEAGIGGRLDPVRLIKAKQLALTSLDLEHTALLGATLDEIARNKIDAAPTGATLLVGQNSLSLSDTIAARCAELGVTSLFIGNANLGAVPPPLQGEHQRVNAALSVVLTKRIYPQLSQAQIRAAFASTRWPGRLEIIEDEPLIVIDVGHTPAGVAAARAGFEAVRGGRDAVLVCGASADKDAAALIAALAPGFSTIICAAARHKGAPAAEIAAHASAANPQAELVIADSVADARKLALSKAKPGESAVYVAGGLFLAAEFKWVHLGRDPALLAFF